MIATVWPEWTSSAAGVRDQALLRAFLHAGWQVGVVASGEKNTFSAELEREGITTARFEANDSRFDAWLAEFRPDCVLFDRFIMEEQFGWRVAQTLPQALRVLDTQDLHSVRRVRQQALAWGRAVPEIARLSWDWYQDLPDLDRELASIYRCDLTLVLSDWELGLLQDCLEVPAELLQLCRIDIPVRRSGATATTFEERRDLVWIGNFRHAPNRDAVQWLHDQLWSKLRRQLPGVELHLYGAYPLKECMEWNRRKTETGLEVKGWAPELESLFSHYRVNAVPLRFGAGIKGKILEGWSYGLPAAATEVGAEGMCGELPFGGLVSQDGDAWIESVVQLYQDKTLWMEAAERGRVILEKLYAPANNSSALVEAVTQRMDPDHLSASRRRNRTGRMLNLHATRSGVYFSRWIELKNRLANP